MLIFPGLPPPIPASMSTSESIDLTEADLERQPDIQVEGGVCQIADMKVVTPDTLLVSNYSKKCVQMVDSRNGRVLSEVQLRYGPGRMCLTDRTTAAVIMGKKIQMIQVKDNTLTKGRELSVSGDMWGITFCKNSLVVSYDHSPWIEVVSMEGKVLQQFDQTGKSQHFKYPWFMCTTSDGSVLISDYETNTITRVDASLNIMQTFTSPLLQGPHGIIAVTEDQILVCSWRNNSLLVLQPSTNTVTTLLGKDVLIDTPHSLAYCPDQKKVYVAQHYCIIKVYQIT